ncbi:MAG: hypothetical protein ACLPSW_30920 [Roseiarcus sp.]
MLVLGIDIGSRGALALIDAEIARVLLLNGKIKRPGSQENNPGRIALSNVVRRILSPRRRGETTRVARQTTRVEG